MTQWSFSSNTKNTNWKALRKHLQVGRWLGEFHRDHNLPVVQQLVQILPVIFRITLLWMEQKDFNTEVEWMNKCPTNYPPFHLLYMVSGGLEPICHRNSSTFESNNKSETKWKTAAPNERWHNIGYVKSKSSPCFTFWNFSFLSRSSISNMETESQKQTEDNITNCLTMTMM